jgi:hypothetical protein
MKLTVKRVLGENDVCAKVYFTQEGMPGLTLTEWEVEPLVQVLETIQEQSSEYFFENVGVHRQVESVTIVRLTSRDEVLLKLTHGKAQKLASSLRASYPEYFH